MSRPREHNQQLAGVLLDAAERRIAADGVDALSLRAVAADAGTTTRAVYTLFGSKDALVGALGVRAMEYLGREVHALTASDDPVADVVAAGLVFRRFALEHPALYSVAFHRASAAVWPLFRDAAAEAFGALQLWFEPLAALGLLGIGPRPMRRCSSMPCARGSPGWSYAATRSGPTRRAFGAALSPRWSPASPRHRPTVRSDPTPLRMRRQHPDRRRPDLVQTPDTPPTARPGP